MTKTLILWDWDNTLADTFGAIFAAQNDARVQYGFMPWTKEESKQAMNMSGRHLLRDIFGADRAAEVRSYFLTRYGEHAAEIELKPGARDILAYAHSAGFINVLASNKTGSILRREVDTLGVRSYFDRIIGAEDTANDKPSKPFTDAAIQGFDADKIISIGDGRADIQMAHNYDGGIGILVWTNPQAAEFAEIQPDKFAPTLADVPAILNRLIS